MKKWIMLFFAAASLTLAAAPVMASGASSAAVATARVNINTAGATELQTLPGIGKVTAEQIVQHRLEHGKFSSLEDLVQVKGVGPKTLEKIRALITIQ